MLKSARLLLAASAIVIAGACSGTTSLTTTGTVTQTPRRLAFAVQPSGVVAGVPLAVVVTTLDADGRLVANATNLVGLTLGQAPSDGFLSRIPTVNSVGGVATFSDVWIEKAGSGYRLIASSPGLPAETSLAFTVSPGPVASIWVDPGAAILDFGTGQLPPYTVQLHSTAVDAYGNATATTWSSSDPTMASVDAAGLVSGHKGVAVISASSGGRSGTATIVTQCGPPRCQLPQRGLAVPNTVRAGVAFSATMSVSCGAFGCGDVGGSPGVASVALASNPSGSTLSGNSDVQISSGVPWSFVWSNLRIDKPGTYRFIAGARGPNGSAVGVTSAAFTVTP